MASSGTPKLKRKLIVMLGILGLLFFVLALRLTQVMIFQSAELQQRAMSQWTSRTQLAAQRGRILDRTGLVLAQSGTSYRVLVNPNWIKPEDRVRVSQELSEILSLDYDYIFERVSNTNRQQVQIKRKVDAATVARITALRIGSGVTFSTDTKRYYPFNSLFAQLIGFSGVDGDGQTGLEAELNTELAGVNGLLVTETDRKGNALKDGTEQFVAAVDGSDITLTVDSVPETYLEKALQGLWNTSRGTTVSGIILDPSTGEILAEASYPNFNLNAPPRDDVSSLMRMSRSRIVTDTFEPGTLFQAITLAAALDSGAVSPDDTFECNRYRSYRLERVYCNGGRRHGRQTLAEAVQNSCSCAYMEMAERMGVDTFYNYLYAFGFGTETKCGIPGEDTGEVTHRKYIRGADLARIANGRGITVTGMQMASAFCAAVNGGILYQPYVVRSIDNTDGENVLSVSPKEIRRVIRPETSRTVRQLLQGVIDNGNGSIAKMTSYASGGITGYGMKYEETGAVSETRITGTFLGFIPTDQPRLMCMLLSDEPQVPVLYGNLIAPYYAKTIFTDLVQYYGILPNTENSTRVMPDVIGLSAAAAKETLEGQGFQVTLSSSEESASVVATIPAPGETVPRYTRALLYTTLTTFNSDGFFRETVTVPNFIGQRRMAAYDTATTAGLRINFDRSACYGIVESQSIAEGEVVFPGTEVYLTFRIHEKQQSAYDKWMEGSKTDSDASGTPGQN